MNVAVTHPHADRLDLAFLLQGNLGQIRIPPPTVGTRGERLWQHTCCEVFLAADTAGAYHEVNLAPSGAWAEYAFTAYRQRTDAGATVLVPPVSVRRGRDQLELRAQLSLAHVAGKNRAGVLRLALSAVVEHGDGSLAYWALWHPAGPPDFHHPDAFTLRVEAPARR